MKAKKFVSLVLALAMIFTMSVTVFASTSSNEFNADATVKIPAIAVTVTQNATLFINPMGFEVKIADGSAAAVGADAGTTTTNKVVSPVNLIKNSSPMNLEVKVIAVVTENSSNQALVVSGEPLTSAETRNAVFIYADFGAVQGADDEETMVTERDYAAGKEAEGLLALTTFAPLNPVKVGEIAKQTGENPSKLGFQFRGDCAENAFTDWHEGDKVSIKMAFTFKPITALSANSN